MALDLRIHRIIQVRRKHGALWGVPAEGIGRNARTKQGAWPCDADARGDFPFFLFFFACFFYHSVYNQSHGIRFSGGFYQKSDF